MGKFIDMTGWVMSEHGVPDSRLTVIKRVGSRFGYALWECECNCDKHSIVYVDGHSLRNGNTISCGCIARERRINRLKKYNEYHFDGNVVIGKSSNTDDEFMIDLEDFDKIKNICWSVCVNASGMKELRGYDQNTQKTWRMHTFLGFSNYDHVDRNELNNCRSNLRIATPQEQVWNRNKAANKSSSVVGVSWHERDKIWSAEIFYNGKKVFRKYFKTESEAIIARLQEEIKYIDPNFSPNRHLYKQYGIVIPEQEEA